MASSMRSESAVGKVPHIFRDHDYPYSASAELVVAAPAINVEKQIADAIAAAVAPLSAALKAADDKLAAASTQISDLKAGKRLDVTPPERKTLTPAITAILAKANLSMPEGDATLDRGLVNKAMKDAGIDSQKSIAMKIALERCGLLAA